jgi:hypothetical protein
MAAPGDWTPPTKVEELFAVTDGNLFSSINRPTAGWSISTKRIPARPSLLPRPPSPCQYLRLVLQGPVSKR